MNKFISFIRDEDGAVTLDWVALSAGVVLLAIGIIAALETMCRASIGQIESNLSTAGRAASTQAGTD